MNGKRCDTITGLLVVGLLIVSQPLLLCIGFLARWIAECGAGACRGAMDAASPIDAPRDVILTAVVVTAPHLLAVLVASVAWLLAGQRHPDPIIAPTPGYDSGVHALTGVTQ